MPQPRYRSPIFTYWHKFLTDAALHRDVYGDRDVFLLSQFRFKRYAYREGVEERALAEIYRRIKFES